MGKMKKVKIGFEIKEEDNPSWIKFKGYVLQKHGMLRGKLGDEIIQLIEQRLKYVEAMERKRYAKASKWKKQKKIKKEEKEKKEEESKEKLKTEDKPKEEEPEA
jgi:hypothetical protein